MSYSEDGVAYTDYPPRVRTKILRFPEYIQRFAFMFLKFYRREFLAFSPLPFEELQGCFPLTDFYCAPHRGKVLIIAMWTEMQHYHLVASFYGIETVGSYGLELLDMEVYEDTGGMVMDFRVFVKQTRSRANTVVPLAIYLRNS